MEESIAHEVAHLMFEESGGHAALDRRKVKIDVKPKPGGGWTVTLTVRAGAAVSYVVSGEVRMTGRVVLKPGDATVLDAAMKRALEALRPGPRHSDEGPAPDPATPEAPLHIPPPRDRPLMHVPLPRVFIDPRKLAFGSLERDVDLKRPAVVRGSAIPGELGARIVSRDVVSTRGRNISESWLRAQGRYIQGLSDDDLLTVAAYTTRSSAWIGPFQRTGEVIQPSTMIWGPHDAVFDKHIVPLYPQLRRVVRRYGRLAVKADETEVARLLDESDRAASYAQHKAFVLRDAYPIKALEAAYRAYVGDLRRIIAAAPTPTRPIVVYRGSRSDPFASGRDAYTLGFTSTAFGVDWAVLYARGAEGYLWRVTLLPGAEVILAAALNQWNEDHGEMEVIVNTGSVYRVDAHNVPLQVVTRHDVGHMRVTDLTVTGARSMELDT